MSARSVRGLTPGVGACMGPLPQCADVVDTSRDGIRPCTLTWDCLGHQGKEQGRYLSLTNHFPQRHPSPRDSSTTASVQARPVRLSVAWSGGRLTGSSLLRPARSRLAEVLDIEDLGDLTGDQRMSRANYTKHAHDALDSIRDALASYPMPALHSTPIPADVLTGRVQQAWRGWHTSRYERDAVAGVLPGLITDAQTSVRLLTATTGAKPPSSSRRPTTSPSCTPPTSQRPNWCT